MPVVPVLRPNRVHDLEGIGDDHDSEAVHQDLEDVVLPFSLPGPRTRVLSPVPTPDPSVWGRSSDTRVKRVVCKERTHPISSVLFDSVSHVRSGSKTGRVSYTLTEFLFLAGLIVGPEVPTRSTPCLIVSSVVFSSLCSCYASTNDDVSETRSGRES